MSTMNTDSKAKKKFAFNIKIPVRYYDKRIYFATLILLIIGAVMVTSASMGSAVSDGMILVKTVIKEVLFIGIGYICMAIATKKFSVSMLTSQNMKILIYLTIAALLICLVFPTTNGSHAWWQITIAGVNIGLQPSEFSKIVSILLMATFLGDNHKKYRKLWNMVRVPVLGISAFVLIVLIIQKDFGSAMVIGLITLIVLLIPTNPQLKKLQIIAICLLVLGIVLIFLIVYTSFGEAILNALPKGYQKNRFLDAINPFINKYGSSYQLVNGLIAFASGGWTGKGLGNSVRKYTEFPAASTDSILAIIVEETGFLGFLLLITLFGIIVFCLLSYARKIHNEKAKMILVGVAMYFMIHIFFNIGGVTVSIPLTGIPLLLISAGGSSTISALIALGISQAVIIEYKRGVIQ